jgi:hypothetical protein
MNVNQFIHGEQSVKFGSAIVSAKTNLGKQVKPHRGGRSQNRRIARRTSFMSRSILIMAEGTGGHTFGYDITPAAHALVSTENVAGIGVFHV